jgi:hypothetical protein
MREYLDRSIDAYWEETSVKPIVKGSFEDIESLKEWVGNYYIQLRGICIQEEVWFEEAVGKAYSELKRKKDD